MNNPNYNNINDINSIYNNGISSNSNPSFNKTKNDEYNNSGYKNYNQDQNNFNNNKIPNNQYNNILNNNNLNQNNNYQKYSNNPDLNTNNFNPNTNNQYLNNANNLPQSYYLQNNNINNQQNQVGNINNNNNIINNFNNNYNYNNNPNNNNNNLFIYRYIFPKRGLTNIGSTCYMNATLQCLLHVNDLILYFIDEYPKDQNTLLNINKDGSTRGDISRAFFNLVKGVCESDNITKKKNEFSPKEFKRILGKHNPQFKQFEANDSKDLILYLLQTMHEELNYFGNKNQRLKYLPDQYDLFKSFMHFQTNYNSNNFSKISQLFYGTYVNTTKCLKCQKILYNFQKFEFISFGMFYYNKKKFQLIDGFKDNSTTTFFKGDNKNFCHSCNQLQDAEAMNQIFEPPKYLLINIDYGKNKKNQPSSVEFDDIMDITQFVAYDYKQKIKYKILGVCTHYGHSGRTGHYVAFCRNRENIWYKFNDSKCSECNRNDIKKGSPYLLLYERIFE